MEQGDGDFIPHNPDNVALAAEETDLKDDVARIQELVREIGVAGGTARVFCVRPGTAKSVYLGEMPVETFTLEGLKAAYGGGDYSIKLVSDGGKYAKTIKVSIDPRCVGAIDRPAALPAQQDPALSAILNRLSQPQDPKADAMLPLLSGMMAMMMESQRANMQIMVAALGGRPQPTGDSKVIDLIMPMALEAMKPKGSAGELLEAFKVFKEISGGTPAATDEKDDMMTRLLQIAGPVVGAFMNRGQPAPQQPIQVNPAPPTPQQSPQQVIPEDPTRAKVHQMLSNLRLVTPVLVRAAAKNAAYDAYLDILDDSLDDEGHAILTEILRQENWVEILFGNNPDVIRHGQWFSEFRLAYLTLDEEDSTQPPAEEQGAPRLV